MIFDLEHQGHLYSQIELALVGRHNVLNAAAVFGLARTLEISEASIRQTLSTFKGVLRRCEIKGTCHGIQFLDDYAHHPTEIQTTLQGIRQAVAPKRLIVVFQPHRYSRTQECLGSYGSIFDVADELLITDIYGAGEAPIPHFSHTVIQQEIEQHSTVPCRYVPRSALNHYLSQYVRPFDVVVTLGAGDITKLSSETISLLEKQPQPLIKVALIWDEETFTQLKPSLQIPPSPYLKIDEFRLEKNFQWMSEEKAETFINQENEPLPMIQQLLECDVCLPLLSNQKQAAFQGFLETLGKAYVKDEKAKQIVQEDLEHLILMALQEKRWKDRDGC